MEINTKSNRIANNPRERPKNQNVFEAAQFDFRVVVRKGRLVVGLSTPAQKSSATRVINWTTTCRTTIPQNENQQHEHFCRAFCATPSKQFSEYSRGKIQICINWRGSLVCLSMLNRLQSVDLL